MTLASQHPFFQVQQPYDPTTYQSQRSPSRTTPVKSLQDTLNDQAKNKVSSPSTPNKNKKSGKRMYNLNARGSRGPAVTKCPCCGGTHAMEECRPILKDRWVSENASSFVWFGHNPNIGNGCTGGPHGNLDAKRIFMHNYDSEDPLRNGQKPNYDEYRLWMQQQQERRQKVLNAAPGSVYCTCHHAGDSTDDNNCCPLHRLLCSSRYQTGTCQCPNAPPAAEPQQYRDQPARQASFEPEHKADDGYDSQSYQGDDSSEQRYASQYENEQEYITEEEDPWHKPHKRGSRPSSEDDVAAGPVKQAESPRHIPRASSGSQKKRQSRGASSKRPSSASGARRPASKTKTQSDTPKKSIRSRSSTNKETDAAIEEAEAKYRLGYKPKQRYRTHFHNYGWANVHPSIDKYYMRSHNTNPQHPSQIYPYMKERRERTHSYDEWKNFIEERERDEETQNAAVEYDEAGRRRPSSAAVRAAPHDDSPPSNKNDTAGKHRSSSRYPVAERHNTESAREAMNTSRAPDEDRRQSSSDKPRLSHPAPAPSSRRRPSSAAPRRSPVHSTTKKTRRSATPSSKSLTKKTIRAKSRKVKQSSRSSTGKQKRKPTIDPEFEELEEQPEEIPPRRFARRETLRREAEIAQPEQQRSPAGKKKKTDSESCEGKEFLPPHHACNHGPKGYQPTPSCKSANRPHDLSFTLGGHSNQDPEVVYSDRPACCHITSAARETRRRNHVGNPQNNPRNYAGLPASYSAFIQPAGEKTMWSTTASDCMRMYD